MTHHKLWSNGPEWLGDREHWPPEIVVQSSREANVETKMIKEAISTAVERVDDEFDELLKKHDLWKVLRAGARINRFENELYTGLRFNYSFYISS